MVPELWGQSVGGEGTLGGFAFCELFFDHAQDSLSEVEIGSFFSHVICRFRNFSLEYYEKIPEAVQYTFQC